MTRSARPTDQPQSQPTEAPTPEAPSPTAEWSPPTVAIERQQHCRMLSTLPIGSPVLIWKPSGGTAVGWSWCGLSGPADCLVRSPSGDVRSCRAVWVRPAPEADS